MYMKTLITVQFMVLLHIYQCWNDFKSQIYLHEFKPLVKKIHQQTSNSLQEYHANLYDSYFSTSIQFRPLCLLWSTTMMVGAIMSILGKESGNDRLKYCGFYLVFEIGYDFRKKSLSWLQRRSLFNEFLVRIAFNQPIGELGLMLEKPQTTQKNSTDAQSERTLAKLEKLAEEIEERTFLLEMYKHRKLLFEQLCFNIIPKLILLTFYGFTFAQ